MARPKKTVPTYRKHSSGQARVTIDGTTIFLASTTPRQTSWQVRLQGKAIRQDLKRLAGKP